MDAIQIQKIEFVRVQELSASQCAECNNRAEFDYAIWYTGDGDEPSETGALCGACSAVILLQESSIARVTLEKIGDVVRAELSSVK